MKKNILICLCFISVFGISQTQKGFFGKNNIVEISARGNVPLIYNLLFQDRLSSFIFDDGSTVAKAKRNWFNYGFSIQNIHYFKKSFGLGLEVGMDLQKASGPDYLEYSDPNNGIYWSGGIKHEMLRLNTISIMPKIEFGPFGSTLPSGISHQFGIGFTITKIKAKDYAFASQDMFNSIPDFVVNNARNELKNSKSFKGFSLLYQMTYRTPISKRLFIAWSMRYSGNFTALNNPVEIFDNFGYVSDTYMDEVRSKVRLMRLSNIIQFSIAFGFSY